MDIAPVENPQLNLNTKKLAPPEVNQVVSGFEKTQKFISEKNIIPSDVQTVEYEGTNLGTKWMYEDVTDEKGNLLKYEVRALKSASYDEHSGPNEICLTYRADREFLQQLTVSRKKEGWVGEGYTIELDDQNKTKATTPMPEQNIVPRAVYLLEKYNELIRAKHK